MTRHPLSGLSDTERSRIAERAPPRSVDPMLATLANDPFTDSDWIFERKLDGVRLLTFRRDGAVRLVSRNHEDRSVTYPRVVEALEMQVRDPDEARDRARKVAVFYWVTPKLACEVAFTEWTTHGKLRHPRFLGLRDDREPEEVRREQAVARPEGGA